MLSGIVIRRISWRSALVRSVSIDPRRAMSLFEGVQLVNAKGDSQDGAECLRDRVVGLYFAADWCPDCRDFQPTLNAFYKDVNAHGPELELVFVGSDRTDADQLAHFTTKQGPWWMLPYDHALRSELKRKYGVCAGKEKDEVGVVDRKGGIPSLVVVQADGELIDLHGAEKVEKDGVAAIGAWKKLVKRA